MPEATAFMLPYSPPVSQFLFIFGGFSPSIKDTDAIRELEYKAIQIVRKTLTHNDKVSSFLKSRLVGDTTSWHNSEPTITIVTTIEVKLEKKHYVSHKIWYEETKVECIY